MKKTGHITSVFRSSSLGIAILAISLMVPFQVFAVPYGEGTYGEGTYGEGTYNISITPGPRAVSPALAPACTNPKPLSAPDLFQIDARPENLILYFSPAMGPQDRYAVVYGLKPDQELWGYEFLNQSSGVVSVEIGKLQRNTRYYFKVRAGNGCQPGDWSNTLSATTGQALPSYKWNTASSFSNTWSKQVSLQPISGKEMISTTTPKPTLKSSPTPKPTEEPKSPTPFGTQEYQPTVNENPPFWERIVNFFKGLFGR